MVSSKTKILIVDDEEAVCDVLYEELSDQGYFCTKVLNGTDALKELAADDFDIALVDLRLPGISGVELLARIQSDYRDTSAVVITAVDDAEIAVETMKLGASDYIVKPFGLDRVNTSIRRLLENKELLSESGDKQTTTDSFNRMNAIAYGVEAELELHDNHSKIVTQRTIELARELGIPEEKIQRWSAARARLDSERHRTIESLLNKLQRSPLAQYIMGMTEPHLYVPESSEFHN